MICLFKPDAASYSSNGEVVLQPSRCEISAELNGAWSMRLEHPFDSLRRWSYLMPDCVLKAPSFNGEQLFRIQSIQKTLDSVTAMAKPIFLDCAKEVFLTDIRPTKLPGQQALDLLMKNTRYRGISDITKTATAYYQYKSLADALTGTDDNSFVNRWGGESLYDNYTISICRQAGKDSGVNVFYGKNLTSVDESVDYSKIITRIYPKGYNGREMSNHGFVESATKYPFARCAAVTYSDVALAEDIAGLSDLDTQLTVCASQQELDAALRQRAQKDFQSGVDTPSVSISIDLAMLYGTAEYRMYKELEGIGLGDRVHCKHRDIGIDSVERVISLTYDCLKKQVSKCTIGSQRYNFIRQMAGLRI